MRLHFVLFKYCVESVARRAEDRSLPLYEKNIGLSIRGHYFHVYLTFLFNNHDSQARG